MRQFARFFYCLPWLETVEFNRLPCPNDKIYDDVVFADRFRYPLTMFGNRVLIWLSLLRHAHIAYEIDTAKIIAEFCRISYCLYEIDTAEFNRLPCPNDKMYDDVVFADRFRYPLTMFGIRVLIGLSRLLHAHIAYEIDTAKIITEICRICYCLHDVIRLNSIVSHVQTTRCTMI